MTLGPVQAALEDAGLKNHEVHEIVLVGGSTRIPKIQELLKDANKNMGRELEDVNFFRNNGWTLDFCFPYFEILLESPGQPWAVG